MVSIKNIGMRAIGLLLVAAAMTACGGKKSFHADCEVEGLGTRTVYIGYRDGEGYHTMMTTSVDSKFAFDGTSAQETVVELFDANRRLIGRFVAKNGDKVEAKLSMESPLRLEAKGNKTSQRLGEFLAQNAKGDIDSAIEAYVAANPKETLSAVLLAYYYDVWGRRNEATEMLSALSGNRVAATMLADVNELMEQSRRLADKMPSLRLLSDGDTLSDFGYSRKLPTIYFFDDAHTVPQTVERAFKDVDDKAFVMAYIRLTPDTFGYRRSLERLPKGTRLMLAQEGRIDSALMSLDLPELPYVIVTDTLGAMTYRGKDVNEALKAANLKKEEL